MVRNLHTIGLAMLAALALPSLAAAQAPPAAKPPVAPESERLDPSRCAPSDTHATQGRGGDSQASRPAGDNLSDKLARSDGVICPPQQVDPDIRAPTPPGGAMPVIPPPGSPGGDPNVRPK